MHLIFERSAGRFKSNCNILSLAWTPYYDESKFRSSLFDYHQRQLVHLTSSIAAGGGILGQNQVSNGLQSLVSNPRAPQANVGDREGKGPLGSVQLVNSRLKELYKRHVYLLQGTSTERPLDIATWTKLASDQLDDLFGRRKHFGWLVVGNVNKTVGVTLTSTVATPLIKYNNQNDSNFDDSDLIKFETDDQQDGARAASQWPENGNLRSNYNLRGHLDEVILVRWNEIYQKLATIDSKGNVLIWCKTNGKFTVQTPFYNKTKSVADFKWSNDGKTALICYTDSFILVGSSTGQRHWHSMLNLDDYHITCASWTPSDEQLLLGVSNGNVVVIDLPRSELTELAINHINIRTMAWSSCDLSLSHLGDLRSASQTDDAPSPIDSTTRRGSVVVNHRRLSRDCSVFSRYNTSNSGNSANSSSDKGPSTHQIGRSDDAHSSTSLPAPSQQTDDHLSNILAIDFANNTIKLYNGLDDPKPRTIVVNQESYVMSWSSDGRCLAVAGFNINTTAPSVGCLKCRYLNAIKFYSQNGELIYEYVMRYTRYPITAFTWAHDDRRIFVATGSRLHCAKVLTASSVAPLSLLAMSCIQRFTRLPTKSDLLDQLLKCKEMQASTDRSSSINLAIDRNIKSLWQSRNCPISLELPCKGTQGKPPIARDMTGEISPSACGRIDDCQRLEFNNINAFRYHLPLKLQSKLDNLFCPTIKQPFDDLWSLSDIIWSVPRAEQRYYCTLVCYTSEQELSMSSYQGRNQATNRQLERSILSFDKRPKKSGSDGSSDGAVPAVPSDMNKIFVMYIEFQGSLIPILRARRVGYLKPEFVIFDPDCDDSRRAQRRSKVSDMSAQQENQQLVADHRSVHVQPNCFSNEAQSSQNNYPDWHIYREPRASGSSMGRQSVASDADQYYNFDLDSSSTPVAGRLTGTNNSKLVAADLTSDRSYYQEPVALPTNNMHLMYMMSTIGASHQSIQGRGPMMLQAPIRSLHQTPTAGNKVRASRRLRQSNLRDNMLNENSELVRIKSNVWGTKFKLINVANRTIKQQSLIGLLVYKASILHLQPRIILLSMKDMSNYCCLCSKHHHTRVSQNEATRIRPKREPSQQMSILDGPNITSLPATPLRASQTRRKATKASKIDDRVFVPVADSLRIAPKLMANQHYQSTNRTDRAQSDHLASINSHRSSRKMKPLALESSKLGTRACESASDTHSAIDNPIIPPRRSLSKNLVKKTEGLASLANQDDDILTLSLWQGDRVRLEMSSLKHEANTRSRESDEKMDRFLASNKSLKSIQSITKMIVDLSSRAGDDVSPQMAPIQTTDSADQDLTSGPSTSRSYVAPDTPVHRPRRPSGLMGADRTMDLASSSLQRATRSATSSPTRSMQTRRRRQAPQVYEPPVELPPPPPSVPIGRRLSSSAKRFIDGSLRSLYSGIGASGYSTSTDAEPDESEPLMSAVSRTASRLLNGHLSQPNSPLKSRARTGRDLSLIRDHLLTRLHGHKGESMRMNGDQLNPRGIIASSPSSSSDGQSESEFDFSLDSDLDSDLDDGRYLRQPLKSRQSTSVKDLSELGKFACRSYSKFAKKRQDNFDKLVGQSQLKEMSKQERHLGAQSSKLKVKTRNKRSFKCPYKNCCCSRELKLTNRPPVWNEQSQVYQLDFGGRVTQESAKNLQIDHKGKLALQFGRIDMNTYTLDYSNPFNAIQAMAIALASLTQRLK